MKRAAKWGGNAILLLVVAFAVFAVLLPSVFSSRLAIVRSSSMEPSLPVGSLALMSPVDTADVEVGDIIAFNPPWEEDVIVSHRVTQIVSEGFVTKGDAVEDADPYVIPQENVVGRLSWHIPYVGYALNDVRTFASSIWGFCLVVVLPSLVIVGSAIRDVNFTYNPAKRRARLLKAREERMKKRLHGSRRLRRAW